MIGTTAHSPQRFLAATLFVALASCSGGGGGGGSTNVTPQIINASFSGASSTPAAGDTILLGFSLQVTLVSGALLTDQDVAISNGASLGDVTVAPSLLSSNTIAVTLGPGVNIEPGTTTIALSLSNDVVGGVSTAPSGGGSPVRINTSDGAAPTINNVTISGIDDELNGTGAAGGTLQVPTNDWTIDLAYSDNSAIATSQTVITADVALSTSSGSQLPGANLRPFLSQISASNTSASYRFPSGVGFPDVPVTLQCIVVDASGLSSTPSNFSFTVKSFTDELRPFETSSNPSQVWFVDFSRDLESYAVTPAGSGFEVDTNNGSNGTSDFEDLLRVIGLTSATPIPNVEGSNDSNVVVINRVKNALLSDLANYYSGANVTFTLTQPSGSFSGNSSVSYNSFGYSIISIAGKATTSGVLGLAIFDPSNSTQNDNSQVDFDGNQRLGVFLHTIVDSGMGQSPASNFRTIFDPLAPDPGGTPIGNDALDGNRLNGLEGDSREAEINAAIADIALFLASVTAHECGHSVGLVENGPMPTGLYGNDATNFPGSQNGHIRNDSIFPSGSVNIMSPSLSYTNATSAFSAFNTLNMAYLREQIFYNSN